MPVNNEANAKEISEFFERCIAAKNGITLQNLRDIIDVKDHLEVVAFLLGIKGPITSSVENRISATKALQKAVTAYQTLETLLSPSKSREFAELFGSHTLTDQLNELQRALFNSFTIVTRPSPATKEKMSEVFVVFNDAYDRLVSPSAEEVKTRQEQTRKLTQDVRNTPAGRQVEAERAAQEARAQQEAQAEAARAKQAADERAAQIAASKAARRTSNRGK